MDFIRYIKFLFIMSLIYSCGRGELEGTNIESVKAGELLTLKSKLNDAEVAGMRNICMAFRSKRLKIQSVTISPEHEFKLTESDCGTTDATISKAIYQALLGDSNKPSYRYKSGDTNSNYITNIETDESGYLEDICPLILDDSSSTVNNDEEDEENNEQEYSLIKYPGIREVEYISFKSPNIFYYTYGRSESMTEKKKAQNELKREQLKDEEKENPYISEYKVIRKIAFKVELNSLSSDYGFIKEVSSESLCVEDQIKSVVQEIDFRP